MQASLPMYDPPHLQWVNDAFWQAIRARLPFDAPAALTHSDDIWGLWEHRDLVLSQTCSLPFRERLHDRVYLVGAPDYGLPGCPPGYYASAIVTREAVVEPAGMRLAFNGRDSQSGWGNAQGLRAVPILETGSHAASLAALVNGQADVAAIDCHTLRILGLPPGLTVRGISDPTPATPYITSRAEWVEPLRNAMEAALLDLSEAKRTALHIRSIVPLRADDYLSLPAVPAPDLPPPE